MTTFKLYAGTHVGLRENNEDNFCVCPDLSINEWIVPANEHETIHLGERGCLIVVADGMGGQNAGEVASAIATDTVQKQFSSSIMPPSVPGSASKICKYLEGAIIKADEEIKAFTRKDASTSGMGSTIVVAWLLKDNLYVGWMGDSRAYSFVPGKGIGRLSKDHSYVQQLVDAGAITDAEAMHHPNSNVITRSLGDPTQKAKPDVICYPIQKGEVILLCTDGLCGVCDDAVIGGIIEDSANLKECKERLTAEALNSGGSDNITVALLKIVDSKSTGDISIVEAKKTTKKTKIISMMFFLFTLVIITLLFFARQGKDEMSMKPVLEIQIKDTVSEAVSATSVESNSVGKEVKIEEVKIKDKQKVTSKREINLEKIVTDICSPKEPEEVSPSSNNPESKETGTENDDVNKTQTAGDNVQSNDGLTEISPSQSVESSSRPTPQNNN